MWWKRVSGDQAANRGRPQDGGQQHAGGAAHLQPGKTALYHWQRHPTAHPQVTPHTQHRWCSAARFSSAGMMVPVPTLLVTKSCWFPNLLGLEHEPQSQNQSSCHLRETRNLEGSLVGLAERAPSGWLSCSDGSWDAPLLSTHKFTLSVVVYDGPDPTRLSGRNLLFPRTTGAKFASFVDVSGEGVCICMSVMMMFLCQG